LISRRKRVVEIAQTKICGNGGFRHGEFRHLDLRVASDQITDAN
jgi:hypothetical protein